MLFELLCYSSCYVIGVVRILGAGRRRSNYKQKTGYETLGNKEWEIGDPEVPIGYVHTK
jgi:hypothetical protein